MPDQISSPDCLYFLRFGQYKYIIIICFSVCDAINIETMENCIFSNGNCESTISAMHTIYVGESSQVVLLVNVSIALV